jgi:hypothetical protein
VEFLEGDLADLSFATRAVRGMDYVLHQAAIPSVPRSVNDPITSNRANVDASLSVLVAARDAGVRRLVYAGSSSAYGNAPTLPKHEDMPAQPLSPALQKLVASIARCSRGHGRDRHDPGISTYSVRGRIPDRRTGRHFAVRDRLPLDAVPRFTAMANRRVISPMWRTWSMVSSACEARDVAGESSMRRPRVDSLNRLDVMNNIVGSDVRPVYEENGPRRPGFPGGYLEGLPPSGIPRSCRRRRAARIARSTGADLGLGFRRARSAR